MFSKMASPNSKTPYGNLEGSQKWQQMAILVNRLYSGYPRQEVNNAELALTEIVREFCKYPYELAQRAAEELPRMHDWPPRLSHIAKWFRDHEPKPVPPEHVKFLPEPAIDRTQRPSYQELVDRCARDGLLIGKKKRSFGEREIAEFRKQYNISDADWDAIPEGKCTTR